MRAIAYNAKERTAEVVEITNYKDYYKYLNCRTFDIIQPHKNVSVFLDDEGLFVEDQSFSLVSGYQEQLAGNLVFTGGVDSKGDTLPYKGSVEEVLQNIIPLN